MTPREKANVIYEKMYNEIPSFPDEGLLEHNSAKQCALIAVDEIINIKSVDRDYDLSTL
jgi:hypothetical protein